MFFRVNPDVRRPGGILNSLLKKSLFDRLFKISKCKEQYGTHLRYLSYAKIRSTQAGAGEATQQLGDFQQHVKLSLTGLSWNMPLFFMTLVRDQDI